MARTTFRGNLRIGKEETSSFVGTAIKVIPILSATKALYGSPVKVAELQPYSSIIDIMLCIRTAFGATPSFTIAKTAGGTDYINASSISGNVRSYQAGAGERAPAWANTGASQTDLYLTVTEAGSSGVADIFILVAPGIRDPNKQVVL